MTKSNTSNLLRQKSYIDRATKQFDNKCESNTKTDLKFWLKLVYKNLKQLEGESLKKSTEVLTSARNRTGFI